jgi:hypothetical protein
MNEESDDNPGGGDVDLQFLVEMYDRRVELDGEGGHADCARAGGRELSRSFTLSAADAPATDPESALDAVATTLRKLCREARQALLSRLADAPREQSPAVVRSWAGEWQARLGEAFAQAGLAGSLEGMRSVAQLLEPAAGDGRTLSSAWDESKHSRDHGKFSSKPGAKDAAVVEKGGGAIPEPEGEEAATTLGRFLRRQWTEYEGDDFDDADHNRCMDASLMIKTLFPDAELYSGVMPGDWEEGGEHKIAKVGEWFIDITSSQFFDNEFVVFSEEDRQEGDYQEYAGFKPWRHPQERQSPYGGRVKNIVAEWSSGESEGDDDG